MYNEEIKERFLEEYAANGAAVTGRRANFNNLSIYEESIGKDLAEMDSSEASSAINSLEYYEYGSATTIFSFFKKYVNWCMENELFDGSPYGVLTLSSEVIDPSEVYKKVLFRDEDDLIKTLSSVVSFNDGNVEVVSILFGWLGVKLPKAICLKESQVDLENKRILNLDGSIMIPCFSDTIRDKLEVYSSTKSGLRMNGTTPYVVVRDNTWDTFIKQFCTQGSEKMGEPIDPDNVTTYISRLKRKFSSDGGTKEISISNAMRSGGLRRVYELEQSGVDVFSNKNKKLVEDVYCAPERKPYYKIIWMYKYYKKAFSI